jgi:hypothetical protein
LHQSDAAGAAFWEWCPFTTCHNVTQLEAWIRKVMDATLIALPSLPEEIRDGILRGMCEMKRRATLQTSAVFDAQHQQLERSLCCTPDCPGLVAEAACD